MPDPLTTVTPVVEATPQTDVLDTPFSEIFADDNDGAYQAPPAQPPATPVEPKPAAAPTVPSKEYFIRTGTGTVYKTEEAAISGIEHKDTLLEQHKRYFQERGIDPVTLQPIAQQPQGPVSYSEKPEQYYQDLVAAVNRNDPKAYITAQGRLINEALNARLNSILPAITETVNARAGAVVSKEIPDFPTVQSSPAFREAMEALPLLKEAITLAETQPEYSGRLPELYRMAYAWTKFRQMPDLLAANATPTHPPQPVRPTVSAGPQPPTQPTTAPGLMTTDGRKALIEAFEKAAASEQRWG